MRCIHGKYPYRCRTGPCKGSIYCWVEQHNYWGKAKQNCRGCKGSGLCWVESHNNLGENKTRCKGCKGSALCWVEIHNHWGKQKQICKGCKGTKLCWDESHNNLGGQNQYCKGCKGSKLCWIESHNNLGKQKQLCKGCKGSALCKKHLKEFCRECDPIKHLTNLVRATIQYALEKKTKRSLDYLGCSGAVYRSYLEKQFKDGMTWENHGKGHGKWNIDHITPLMYIDETGNPPTQEEIERRLYYTNTQPLWYEENMEKGNRFVG